MLEVKIFYSGCSKVITTVVKKKKNFFLNY